MNIDYMINTDWETGLYLTGSRFFGGANVYSDWDFFMQYTPELYQRLIAEGWEPRAGDYVDGGCVNVLQKSNVHLQLVKDASVRAKQRDMIAAYINISEVEVSKRQMQLLWGLVRS